MTTKQSRFARAAKFNAALDAAAARCPEYAAARARSQAEHEALKASQEAYAAESLRRNGPRPSGEDDDGWGDFCSPRNAREV